jgi:hypothetical protein
VDLGQCLARKHVKVRVWKSRIGSLTDSFEKQAARLAAPDPNRDIATIFYRNNWKEPDSQ